MLERFRRMFPLDPHFNTLGSKYELMELIPMLHFIPAMDAIITTILPHNFLPRMNTYHYSTVSVSLKVALQVRGAWVLAIQDLAESVRNSKDLPRSHASDLALLFSGVCVWIPSSPGVLINVFKFKIFHWNFSLKIHRFFFFFVASFFFFPFKVICVFKLDESSEPHCKNSLPVVSSFSTYIIMQCYLLCWLLL